MIESISVSMKDVRHNWKEASSKMKLKSEVDGGRGV